MTDSSRTKRFREKYRFTGTVRLIEIIYSLDHLRVLNLPINRHRWQSVAALFTKQKRSAKEIM